MRVTPIECSTKERQKIYFFGTYSNNVLLLIGPNLLTLVEISFASKHFLESNLLINEGMCHPQSLPVNYLTAEKIERFSKGGETRKTEVFKAIHGVHYHFQC